MNMENNLFKTATEYLSRAGLEPSNVVPNCANFEAETYEFEGADVAVAAAAELGRMITNSPDDFEYVRIDLQITPNHALVTLIEGDDEWDDELDNFFDEFDEDDE